MPNRKTKETEDVADLVHGAAIRLLRFVRREDSAFGLSAPQLSTLSVLVFGGPQTMSALAVAEQVRPPTMSRTVDELERLELALRVARGADRRVSEVRVTPKGRALLEKGRRKRLKKLVTAMRSLSAKELRTLRDSATIIVRITDSTI
jgi:DNA-binding MarR family transcriptional regulator